MGTFLKKVFGDSQYSRQEKHHQTLQEDKAQSKDTTTMNFQYLAELLEKVEENTRDGCKNMAFPAQRAAQVAVYVRVGIVNVGDIDTVKQEVDCEFYLSLRWTEPMLEYDLQNNVIAKKGTYVRWQPDIFFPNLLNYDLYEMNEQWKPPLVAYEPPQVMLYYHIRGKFKQIFDVRSFPFDYQTLNIKLTTRSSSVDFRKDPLRDDTIRTANFAGKNEWYLQQHVLATPSETEVENGSTDNIFSVYDINLHAKRHSGHYLFNVALIMSLITALTFASYTVDASSPADRLSVTLTLLLTSVAMKYVVNSYVPQVAYLTLLDQYIISSMVFQFLIAVQNAIASLVHKHFKSSLGQYELASFGVLVSFYVIIQIGFGCWSLVCWLKVRKLSKMHDLLHYSYKSDEGHEMKEIKVEDDLRRNSHTSEIISDVIDRPQAMYSIGRIL